MRSWDDTTMERLPATQHDLRRLRTDTLGEDWSFLCSLRPTTRQLRTTLQLTQLCCCCSRNDKWLDCNNPSPIPSRTPDIFAASMHSYEVNGLRPGATISRMDRGHVADASRTRDAATATWHKDTSTQVGEILLCSFTSALDDDLSLHPQSGRQLL